MLPDRQVHTPQDWSYGGCPNFPVLNNLRPPGPYKSPTDHLICADQSPLALQHTLTSIFVTLRTHMSFWKLSGSIFYH